MANRKSGAQRRAAQKAAQRQSDAQEQNDKEQPQLHKQSVVSSKVPALKPELGEVLTAVESLYIDEMKPYGRLLRKRISERSCFGSCVKLPEVDLQHLRAVCEASSELTLQPEAGGDWSVRFTSRPSKFVDIYSSDDTYPTDLWVQMATYFESASADEMTLPGGRYACAQALQSRSLPFFDGYSLAKLCHIVQLAISEKKLLGYQNGSVVTYGRSQSKLKEALAEQRQADAHSCTEAASLPCATWEQARGCLVKILEEARGPDQEDAAQMPLSNVKRVFRSRFSLELSETMLGYSKLSELLQDDRFAEICYVELDGRGYTVVERRRSEGASAFCPDEPLCLDDAVNDREMLVFDATPGPFASAPVDADYTSLGSIERLNIEDAGNSEDAPSFGATPGPFGPTPLPSPFPQPLVDQTLHENQNFLKDFLQEYLYNQAHDAKHEVDTYFQNFCPDEPLSLDEASKLTDAPGFGPSPGPAWSPPPQARTAMSADLAAIPCTMPYTGFDVRHTQQTFMNANLPVSNLFDTLPYVSSMGDVSGSTSARSTASDDFGLQTHCHAESFKPVDCTVPLTLGATDALPAAKNMAPKMQFEIQRVGSTMPYSESLALCPPCPPPPLPPVLRLSDHLS